MRSTGSTMQQANPKAGYPITLTHLCDQGYLSEDAEVWCFLRPRCPQNQRTGCLQRRPESNEVFIRYKENYFSNPHQFIKAVFAEQNDEKSASPVGRSWQSVYVHGDEKPKALKIIKEEFIRKEIFSLGIHSFSEERAKIRVRETEQIDEVIQKFEKLKLGNPSRNDILVSEPGELHSFSNNFYTISQNSEPQGLVPLLCSFQEKMYFITCHHVVEHLAINATIASRKHTYPIRDLKQLNPNKGDDIVLLQVQNLAPKGYNEIPIYGNSSTASYSDEGTEPEAQVTTLMYGANSKHLLNIGKLSEKCEETLTSGRIQRDYLDVQKVEWLGEELPTPGDCGGVYFTKNRKDELEFLGMHVGTRPDENSSYFVDLDNIVFYLQDTFHSEDFRVYW